MVTQASARIANDLQELVLRHEIRWHATHEDGVIAGELRAIGLKLELSARHAHPLHPPTPGCPECQPVICALERVVEAVLPKEHRRSHYEVHVPPATLIYPPGARPEITASITILHNEGINEPVDACETRCMGEMIAKLKSLGARESSR